MDPFKRAGDFYAQAFAAQGAAAAEQAYSQQRGDKEDAYKAEVSEQPYNSPVPPKSGPFGVFKDPGDADADFVEGMKRDLLLKAAANRRTTNGMPAARAGGGAPTQSLS